MLKWLRFLRIGGMQPKSMPQARRGQLGITSNRIIPKVDNAKIVNKIGSAFVWVATLFW